MDRKFFRVSKYPWVNPEQEVDEILRFYESNRDPGNRTRDAEELIRAGKAGEVYRVSDVGGKQTGVACIFFHQNGAYEAGGTRIISNGFGLQKILHKCRLIHTYLLRQPDREYFAIVDNENAKSIAGTEKCGFDKWEPDTAFKTVVGKLDSPRSLFFQIDFSSIEKQSVIQQQARELLKLHSGDVEMGKDGNNANVVLDFPLFSNTRLLDMVERLANGEL